MKLKLKIFSTISAFALIFSLLLVNIATAEPSSVIAITDCVGLQAMKDNLDGNYQLANDIDCSATGISDTENEKYDAYLYNEGLGFEPVGTCVNDEDSGDCLASDMFIGQLDGNNKTISGLFIDRGKTDYVGLFGMLGSGATVQNLDIVSGAIAGQSGVGAVAGMATGDITIDNVTVSVNVIGFMGRHLDQNDYGYAIGGLIGDYEYLGGAGLTLTNNTMNGTVAGDYFVGGLIGYNYYDWAGNSEDYSLNMNNNTVSASSGISGDTFVGGLIGYVGIYSNTDGVEASLTMDVGPNNAVLADISAAADNVGGMIGQLYYEDYNNFTFDFTISQSFVKADVHTDGNNVGGLIGSTDMRCNGIDGPGDNCNFKVNISDAYYNGDVSGNSYVGGLIGYASERDLEIEALAINRSYTTGSVMANVNDNGGYSSGGFIGYNNILGSINNSFTANVVDGNGTDEATYVSAGTFVGVVENGGVTFSNAYYDQAKNPATDNPAMTCSAGGSMSGCSAVNTDGLSPNYFFNNSSNHPFDNGTWNFSTIWQTNVGNYPTFKTSGTDTTGPIFEALGGGDTRTVNIDAGQVITTNPYIIKVKPTDSSAVTKVEFYIDNILICTDTTADVNGYYSCQWDTSKYHSDVKIIAYDALGNSTTLTRTTTVNLTGVPNTGLQSASYLLAGLIVIAGIGLMIVARRRISK